MALVERGLEQGGTAPWDTGEAQKRASLRVDSVEYTLPPPIDAVAPLHDPRGKIWERRGFSRKIPAFPP